MTTTTKSTLSVMDKMPLGKHDDSCHQLECVRCGHKHEMKDRKTKQRAGLTYYYCPECGEESYYNLTAHKGE